MKKEESWGKYTKIALAIIDIIIIALAYMLTQVFVQENYTEINRASSNTNG